MPGDAVQFLSLDEALVIHERLIDRFDADSAHRFIVGSLEQGTLDYAHVLAWMEAHLERL